MKNVLNFSIFNPVPRLDRPLASLWAKSRLLSLHKATQPTRAQAVRTPTHKVMRKSMHTCVRKFVCNPVLKPERKPGKSVCKSMGKTLAQNSAPIRAHFCAANPCAILKPMRLLTCKLTCANNHTHKKVLTVLPVRLPALRA